MIVFVRHGETASNRSRLLLGRGNDPALTDLGTTQAASVAARLAHDTPPARLLASPLLRTRETAAAIALTTGVDIEIDERLVEMEYGDWEGLPVTQLDSEEGRRWRNDPSFAPPGGESLLQVALRVGTFCEEYAAGPEVVVAVSHVSPIKAAAVWALDAAPGAVWQMWLGLASITTVTVRGGVPSLLGFNDVGHLKT
jgi:broad specificity phosphatase PhoE